MCVGEVKVGETQLACDWSMPMRGKDTRSDPAMIRTPSIGKAAPLSIKSSQNATTILISSSFEAKWDVNVNICEIHPFM